MSLFARANLGLNLSPAERALLKLIWGFLVSAALAGVTAAYPFITGGNVNWHTTLAIGLVAMGVTLMDAVKKYFTAHGDVPLANLAGDLESGIAAAGKNLPKEPS